MFEPVDFIGVDRGIVNPATTSDGDNHQGRRLGRYRRWQARKRAEIQARRTRSAKQLLRKRAKKAARHATHVNHKVAKTVGAVAQRTERGIALEELQGIRERVTAPRDHLRSAADGGFWTRMTVLPQATGFRPGGTDGIA